MINVIVPITNNAEKYVESLSQLSLRSDVNLVIGITESLNRAVNLNFPNAKTKVFDDKSKKEDDLKLCAISFGGWKNTYLQTSFFYERIQGVYSNTTQLLCLEKRKKRIR